MWREVCGEMCRERGERIGRVGEVRGTDTQGSERDRMCGRRKDGERGRDRRTDKAECSIKINIGAYNLVHVTSVLV